LTRQAAATCSFCIARDLVEGVRDLAEEQEQTAVRSSAKDVAARARRYLQPRQRLRARGLPWRDHLDTGGGKPRPYIHVAVGGLL